MQAARVFTLCIRYSDNRDEARDRMRVSLTGGSGVQLNMTRSLGLFAEPAFSFDIPTGGRGLSTYRSDHPLMFTITGGIRVTLHQKN